MVLSSVATATVVDAATTAVSGLSFYYCSVAAITALSLVEMDADATLVADASLTWHIKRGVLFCTPLFLPTSYSSPANTTSVNIIAHGTI